MSRIPTRAVIILECEFGGSLEEIAERSDVWIVDTPRNRAAAENLWGHRPPDSLHTVTTFEVELSLSPEAWVIDVLPSLDDHHGLREEWASDVELQIIGASATEHMRAELQKFGAFVIEQNHDGFTARRKSGI